MDSSACDLDVREQGQSLELASLPHQVLLLVLEHLDTWERNRVGAVCRQWYYVSRDPVLWQRISLSTHPKTVTDMVLVELIRRSSSVWFLDLDGCMMVSNTGYKALAEHCTSLRQLRLSYTSITADDLLDISECCKDLTHLSMRSSAAMDGLSAFPLLAYLDIGDTVATDDHIIKVAEHCPLLQHLHLRNTMISDRSLPYIASLKFMKYLSLRSCW